MNKRIHGVRVLGTLGDLPRLVEEYKPEEVVVAVPKATPAFLRDLISQLEPYEVSIKTLPGVKELLARSEHAEPDSKHIYSRSASARTRESRH